MDAILKTTNISESTVWHKALLYQTALLTVPFHQDFIAAANTQSFFLLRIPERTLIVGVLAKLNKKFIGAGVIGCSVTVGGIGWSVPDVITSIINNNFYMPAFECTQVVSPTSFMYWSPVAMLTTDVQDIQANFTTTGAYLSALTSGEIELNIMYRIF